MSKPPSASTAHGAPTAKSETQTEAKTQCYGGPVVNPGPYFLFAHSAAFFALLTAFMARDSGPSLSALAK